ncbi:MAG: SWIM zinc finger family protein [Elainella sp. Prado103]|nr:SWIM zinc finger family protein [Elainella sp. Prado103]
MTKGFSKTWWGQQFIAALEEITDPGRLSRGRSYARGNKVKSFQIQDGGVMAQVRGSVNPYFGVYKEPLYTTVVNMKPISPAKWNAVIAHIATKASFISKLLLNEVPDNIEEAFQPLGVHLLPHARSDFETSCTCPDYSNPCKHIAGVYYLLASELDRDPFLLFELRGLSRERLRQELARSPLGIALAAELSEPSAPRSANSYHTAPRSEEIAPAAAPISLRDFWQGAKRLPKTIDPPPSIQVPAVLIKKQGDYPSFWDRDQSFIETMTEIYKRVRSTNKL